MENIDPIDAEAFETFLERSDNAVVAEVEDGFERWRIIENPLFGIFAIGRNQDTTDLGSQHIVFAGYSFQSEAQAIFAFARSVERCGI